MIKFRAIYKCVSHNIIVIVLAFLLWGVLWCTYGEDWGVNGKWFRVSALAATAWACGQILETLTRLPPCLAALFVGILARNLDLIDMRHHMALDMFFRKLGPVVILGKASLGWDTDFMIAEWKRILCLGTFPWISEVLTASLCVHYFLGFPWIWGLLLGSIYASHSCAMVLPSVGYAVSQSGSNTRNWSHLVCTAGGLDTALSVGVYGLVHSYMFVQVSETYKVLKAILTLFVGVVVGVSWGSMSQLIPHQSDRYVVELRILFIFFGGLFGNLFFTHIGCGGVGGVAVLACNMTAAMHWRKEEKWKLNQNPAATAYRVMWTTVEPVLFSFTGTYCVLNKDLGGIILVGLGIFAVCLAVRLCVASIVCWDFAMKEKIFICCAWTPKTIVEMILCPVAVISLVASGEPPESRQFYYAENLLRLILELVIISTPLGFLLTRYLGPWLLSNNKRKNNGSEHQEKP